ncbi:DEAD/DEAH box helicase [Rhodoplanes sp. Z2-YC6860]|uniref:DEAD/DEAH box helicase n=1 Tax=Rhodoplanes sp. Z2-YC6860 TaxID=674703 RepID=UPI00078E88CA|nr:DEAD/DEAH box helicase [Rhodoplanes sp. Z2-YC6860]AMN41818.1 DEAD/DEAH box helicase [Rhodoplanes sp. Z2-YC6860]
MTSFNEFGLAEPILRSLIEEGYVTPTPIQAQTIPLLLAKRDVIGIAQTGTGKTAAFALPIIHHLAANRVRPQPKTCRVLVLSPTRELSGQILDSFRTYGRHLRLHTSLAIGGVNMGPQVRQLAHGTDVLVATPGRLLDLAKSRAIILDKVEFFVLDEADRMLDMGFIHDIRKIVAKLPKERQTLLFSATMPSDIAELARHMLKDPAKVAVTPAATTVERIAQRIIHLDRGAKQKTLSDLLRAEPIDRVLVFTRTKHGADKVVRGLEKDGIASDAIHGNKSQNQRTRALKDFRDGRIRTLVATDIAARGIDVEGVSHVINFDLPNVPESYVHRIGRTARAGADGVAISLCSHDELPYLRDIEKLIRMAIPATGSTAQGKPAQQQRPQQHQGRNGNNGGHRSQNGHRQGHGQQAQGEGQNRNRRNGQKHHGNKPHGANPNGHRPNNGQKPHQGQNRPQHNGGSGNPGATPRPIAPTQPIGSDFQNVAFMQTR